jgi:hypothetical protein
MQASDLSDAGGLGIKSDQNNASRKGAKAQGCIGEARFLWINAFCTPSLSLSNDVAVGGLLVVQSIYIRRLDESRR